MTAIPAAPTPGAALPAVTARVDVVSIQSQVVYGCVGNNAAMPIFRQAGLRAVAGAWLVIRPAGHGEPIGWAQVKVLLPGVLLSGADAADALAVAIADAHLGNGR